MGTNAVADPGDATSANAPLTNKSKKIIFRSFLRDFGPSGVVQFLCVSYR